MRNGLLAVRTYVIPSAVLADTLSFLREVGREGFEGFVLWGGVLTRPDEMTFRSALIPRQRAMQTESGLLVTVEGSALFDVNRTLHERGEVLAAQVHSHPTEAYHSTTDDDFPMVTLMGALSIVVPDFAKNAPADIDAWAWYRLSRSSRWRMVDDSVCVEII